MIYGSVCRSCRKTSAFTSQPRIESLSLCWCLVSQMQWALVDCRVVSFPILVQIHGGIFTILHFSLRIQCEFESFYKKHFFSIKAKLDAFFIFRRELTNNPLKSPTTLFEPALNVFYFANERVWNHLDIKNDCMTHGLYSIPAFIWSTQSLKSD